MDRLFPVRLQHPHYYLNALLSTPIFILLLTTLWRVGFQELSGPPLISFGTVLAALPVLTRLLERSELIETRRNKLTTRLKMLNLLSLFLLARNKPNLIVLSVGTSTSRWLEIEGRYLIYWYLLAWVVCGFCLPQPPYLGESKVVQLSSDKFDEKVLFIAPAGSTASSEGTETIGHADISLLPSLAMMDQYKQQKKESDLYRVVLFHAEWSMKSRESEMVLAEMSCSLTSPSLEFNILTTESAPTTFYDLELSIHASSFDLPVLYLYHRGEIIGKLPGDGEFVKGKRERKPEVEDEGVDSASEDGDEGMESEDERDVERRKGLARMKWDRSSKSIIEAFDLKSKSAGKSA